jgi:ABC-type nitrate/sulfonate/bicarbonate transport system substrate-binding protein
VAIEFRNLPMNTENQRPLINLLCLGAVGLSAIVLSIAHRRELFKKHGANVQLIPVPGTQLPELTITNPVGHIGAPATIMRAAGGAELRILASLDNGRLSNHLVVSPDIAKPEDLRGKCLGARVTGAALWINTVLALEQLGLDLKRDNINIVPIGDPSHIMRALEERRIDGAVLSTAQSRELKPKDFPCFSIFHPQMCMERRMLWSQQLLFLETIRKLPKGSSPGLFKVPHLHCPITENLPPLKRSGRNC